MKKLLITLMTTLLPYCLPAQEDAKAGEILDKTVAALTEGSGIHIEFEGTEKGNLMMKGEKFYLQSGNIQSWYDGKTQWSYVADTDEVNVSNPTQEELRGINPYYMLLNYRKDFHYQYTGNRIWNEKQGFEIVLTPREKGSIDAITLFVTKNFQPLGMKIQQNGQTVSKVNITLYRIRRDLDDSVFRFNKSLYPNAEVIDLR